MDRLLRDLQYGLRLLWKEKAFSATVLLTLTVCIGANTTIFSVINKVLLEPLPYSHPEQLVTVFNAYPGAGAPRASSGGPDFFFHRERIDAFQEVASYQGWGNTVGEAGSTERASTMRVTSTFFPLLGVAPVLGRNFTWEEMERGNHRKVILSYSYWQERFEGDPSVLERTLRVDGEAYDIVGVLPENFRLAGEGEGRDFFLPIPFDPEDQTLERWHNNNYSQMARLAPDATVEQARAQMDALNASLIPEWPVPGGAQLLQDAGFQTRVVPAKDDLLAEIKPTLILLWAGVAFVLLIGCVNIANLMLARSNVRMRELATRLALGADRGVLGRQLLTEAVLLGVMGGVLGFLLGYAGLQLLGTLGVQNLPRGSEISMDGTVALFTLALGLGAGLLFGTIPLVHVMRSDLNTVFRAESRSGTSSRGAVLLRSSLVTVQVAVAFILLIGAGLMLRSFRAVLDVDPGFDTEGVLAGNLSLPASRYPDGASRMAFLEELQREVRALPGVKQASYTEELPFTGNISSSVIFPEGYIPPPGESVLSPYTTWAGPGYFETMGIPLREGRTFDSRDVAGSQQVVILDEWLANRYFPDESPIGKRMLFGTVPGMEEDEEPHLYTIVGVVGSHRQSSLVESSFVGAYYLSAAQQPGPFQNVVLKTGGDPMALVEPVREIVTRLDPELPFFGARTMQARIDESLLERRSPMLLLMIFAAVALFLAAVGIYGALAYTVTQRTREVGIRIAMGSSAGAVFGLVLRQGLKVVGIGLLLGGAGSLALVRLIQSLLYGIQPADPGVIGSVGLLLGCTGLVACLLPARRATRVDPVEALAD